MSRLFLTGDTHTTHELTKKFHRKNFTAQNRLTKNDVVIILGDVGSITWDNSNETKWNREYLANKNFTTAFVDGNHDNFDIINNLPTETKWGGKVGVIETPKGNIYHLRRGESYFINGKRILTIGGANSVDKLYRIPERSWWEAELLTREEETKVLTTISAYDKFDLILTHTCPASISGEMIRYKGRCPVESFLEYIYRTKLNFDKWYFGHYHEDTEVNDEFTCIYNKILEIE